MDLLEYYAKLHRLKLPAGYLYRLTNVVRAKPAPMPMNADAIKAMIIEALPDATVEIEDLAGDGDHYRARVISAAFKGKNRVQQHQLVYRALKGKMGGELHALALETEEAE